MLPLTAYVFPILGAALSRYLDEYVLVVAYLLPVLVGGATLILVFESASRNRFFRRKAISVAAMILSLMNLLVYPLVLLVVFNVIW